MRVVLQDHLGPPDQVLRVEPRPPPRPRAREVVVALEASPIHAADLQAVSGHHPERPRLPGAIPGREGLGRVIEVGSEVDGLREGDRVLLPLRPGAWRDRSALQASLLRPAPPAVAAEQLAMARVAPLTATVLLRAILRLRSGEWLIQNAANGSVGLRIAARARQLGIRTVNLIRRPEAERVVRQAGGDVVLIDRGRPLLDEIRAYTQGASIRLALDGVGGDATATLARALAHGGTLVHYGSAHGPSLSLPTHDLLARDLTVQGFWLPVWWHGADATQREAMEREALDLVAAAPPVPVVATYGLGQIAQAVQHAAREGRNGKVLLTGEAWNGSAP